MGSRTIYFCDWCQVESPLSTSIPCDWLSTTNAKTGAKEQLCTGCVEAVDKALATVRAEREAIRAPRDRVKP
jgi:hypothetical protein